MSKNVSLKIIRSDKQKFIIDGEIWGLSSLEGFDHPSIEIFSEKNSIGDGSTVTGQRVSNVDRTFTAILKNKNLNEIMRKVSISFFNPKYSYEVYITYQGQSRYFNGSILGFKCPNENVYKPIEITCTFLSESPYLKSIDDFGMDIASINPEFGFPYISCIDTMNGFTFGSYNFAKTVDISNDGDVETYCKAVFTAKGNVTNPKLIKDLKYVRIIDTLVSEDVIEIDFTSNPPTVKKNGVNIIAKTDRTSSFTDMQLQTGSNTIGFSADVGENVLSVIIYYNKLYLGV